MLFKKVYTHNAKLYGIPCYLNADTMDIDGANFFFDVLATVMKLYEIFAFIFIKDYNPWDNIEIISEI